MLEKILQFDKELFLAIYNLPHPFIFSSLAWMLSGIGHFGMVWIGLGYFMKKLKPVLMALFLVLLIGNIGLKNLIARPRPFPSTFDFFLSSDSFSFPSGHAAAAFASAFVLTRNKKQKTKSKKSYQYINILIWLLAILISFSRIYLGRHYPLDVLAGGIIGWFIGEFAKLGNQILKIKMQKEK